MFQLIICNHYYNIFHFYETFLVKSIHNIKTYRFSFSMNVYGFRAQISYVMYADWTMTMVRDDNDVVPATETQILKKREQTRRHNHFRWKP